MKGYYINQRFVFAVVIQGLHRNRAAETATINVAENRAGDFNMLFVREADDHR